MGIVDDLRRKVEIGKMVNGLKVGDCLNCGENNWSPHHTSFCRTCFHADISVEIMKRDNSILWALLLNGTDEEVEAWLVMRKIKVSRSI